MPVQSRRAGVGFYLLPALVTSLLLSGCTSLMAGPGGDDTLHFDQLPRNVARHYVTVTIETPREVDGSRARDGAKHQAGGVLLGRSGLAVTAAHLARATGNRAMVTTHEGNNYPADIVHVSPANELAILRVDLPAGSEPSPPVINRSPRIGAALIGIGLPTSRSITVRTGTVRIPRQKGKFRFGEFGFRNPLVANLRIGSGFSGGPVFDSQQRWLGMIVGYELARTESGEYRTVEKAYVLPAADILAYIEDCCV